MVPFYYVYTVDTEHVTKNEAQQSEERFWYQKIDVYVTLSRAGWLPSWVGQGQAQAGGQGGDMKRVKVE